MGVDGVMEKPIFVLPRHVKMESVVEKTISEGVLELENGYAILVRRERISTCGRSIFREIDEEQIVLEILDEKGKVTKRLPIPAKKSDQVASMMAQ